MTAAASNVLVTGASGYIGGLLYPLLVREGFRVRCLVRRPETFAGQGNAGAEIVQGDMDDIASLEYALRGIDTAFYLVHAMHSKGTFEGAEARQASNFSQAARRAGLKKIIYLGGLGAGKPLSKHLESRLRVGQILRESGVLTLEFRASIIIGPGSISFELIRALMNRLPIMVTPRWIRIQAQPIAVEDVLSYLTEAIRLPVKESAVFEIGGPDRLSYMDLMKMYARARRLKRLIIPVPVLTPWLSSLWLALVTPLYSAVGRRLIESIRHETIVRDPAALQTFSVKPDRIENAMRRAVMHYEEKNRMRDAVQRTE